MSETFPAAAGDPPSIEWIAPARLRVDQAYQRSIETKSSRDHVLAIARRWDWRLCQPLAVSRRLPAAGLFVIDGQHRLEAARLRGDIAHLPCSVTTFETVAEEAHLFVAANRGRRPMSRFDDHRAAVAAGNEEAIAIEKVVRAAGLTIATTPNQKVWEAGQVGAIAGIRTGLRLYGETVVAGALVQIAEAFPDERMTFAGTMLAALYPILHRPPEGFTTDRLFAALLSRNQAEWMDGIEARVGGAAVSALRARIVATYQQTEA